MFTGINKAISPKMSALQKRSICCFFSLCPQSFQPSLMISDALTSLHLKLFLLVFNSNNSLGKKNVSTKHGGIRDKGTEVKVLFVHICKPDMEKFSILLSAKNGLSLRSLFQNANHLKLKTRMIFFKSYLDCFKIIDHDT